MISTAIPLSIIIPCYNEQEVIPFLAKTLSELEKKQHKTFSLTYIFVDDGSSDNTWALLQHYFPPTPTNVTNILLRHPFNQGIGAAIITGFQSVTSPYVAVIDSDCTFHPAQIVEMIKLMKPDIQVVTSSPLSREGEMLNVPKWRQLMSYGAACLYRRVLKQKLTSYTSCFRIFRREVISDLRLSNYGFSGVTEILVRLDFANTKFAEFPATLSTREYGQSKCSTVKTTIEHLNMISRIFACKWFGYRFKDLSLPIVQDIPYSTANLSSQPEFEDLPLPDMQHAQ